MRKAMAFIDYTNAWARSEVYQAKIMVGIGIFILIGFIAILRSENELLKGSLLPLGLLLAILVGYGGSLFYSRPAHAEEIISLYKTSPTQAVKQETAKHVNDSKVGKSLMRIYAILMLFSVITLFVNFDPFYKGMAMGFLLLFIATFVVDNGFVARSDSFLSFLKQTTLVDKS